MANFSEDLKSSLKNVLGKRETKEDSVSEKPTKEKTESVTTEHLKITAKNFLALDSMARDLNVASQNIKELVRVMGGKPRDKEDMHMLKESELEEKLKVETEKEKLKAPTPEPKETKKGITEKVKSKVFEKFKKTKVGQKAIDLKKQFSESNILKTFKKYFAIAAIIGIIFVEFKDTLVEWVENLWDAIKEKFDEFVTDIKKWFEEVVQPIIDNVKEFIDNMITKVSEFFKSIGDWISEKFGQIADFFEPVVSFVKKVWDKFMGLLDGLKSKIRPIIEKAMGAPIVGKGITDFVKSIGLDKFLGIGQTEEKKVEEEKAKKEKTEKPAPAPAPVAAPAPAPKPAAAPAPAPTPAPVAAPAPAPETTEPTVVTTGAGVPLTTGAGVPVTAGAPEVTPTPAPPAPTPAPAAAPAKAAPAAAPPPTAPTPEPKVPTPTGDDKWIMDMIKKHEGVRTKPYKDTKGLWTVGVGHLIGDGKKMPVEDAGIQFTENTILTNEQVDKLFALDYEKHKKQAEASPGYDKANEKGKAALIDLAFNMGGAWYKNFKKAAAALAQGDFQKAADELIDSDWYKQVKGRAATVVAMIRDGIAGKGAGKPTAVAAAPTPAPTPAPAAGAAVPTKSLSSVASIGSGVDISGLSDELKKRVSEMAAAFKEKTGKKLLITSAFRTNEKQKELWDAKVAELGGNEAAARKLVAEPAAPLGKGKGSLHAVGGAIDINSKNENGINVLAGSRDKSTGWLEKFGLMRNVPNEDWHIQLAGTAPVSDTPANPGVQPTVPGKDGKPVDASTGKKETIGPTPTPSTSDSGTKIASASTEVAADQRQQQKPQTPNIINAPTTNNKTYQVSKTAAAPQQDASTTLVMRAV